MKTIWHFKLGRLLPPFSYPLTIEEMIKKLAEDLKKSPLQPKIIAAISKKIGRKLDKNKDHILIDCVDRLDVKTNFEFMYGAIVFEGEVYGFLEVDYSEPCLNFIPSSKLAGIW